VIVVALVVALAVFALPGLTPKTYAVPSLTGDTVAQAQAAAHNSHFTVVERDVREGPPFANIHDQNPEPNTRHRAGTITVDVSVGYPFVTVPPLTGDTLAQARAALASVLVVLSDTQPQAFSDSISAGHVISWQPRDNVAQHDTITVTVSGGPEFVSMPSVVGQTLANAESALQNVGITQPPTQVQAFSDTVAAGSVISSDPPAGGTADRAKSPALTVSKGPDVVKVPDVTGDTVEVAEAALRAAGLAPAGPYGPPGADIVDFTAPAAGRKIKRGSTVSLYSNYV
jgi:serine/threonine-protein kinase